MTAGSSRLFSGILAIAVGGFAGALDAQDADEILQTALERHAERVAGVEDYTVVQEVMGTPATVHFEKRIVDGYPTFQPVSMFTVMQERVDAQRGGFLEALARGGLSQAAPGLTAASYGQLGDFFQSATEIGAEVIGTDDDGEAVGPDAVRDVLVRSAARAGLGELSSAIGGARGEQIAQIGAALAGLGDESILGQLGKVALGEAKSLALEQLAGAIGGPIAGAAAGAMGGGGTGGLAGMLGGSGGPGGGGVGPQAAGGLAQAGLGALMGGASYLATEAMMPDLSALDRTAEPIGIDPYQIMRLAADASRVDGTETIAGASSWVLVVETPARLELPDADDFTPRSVTLYVDRETYVLRGANVAGDLTRSGQTVPVTMETRLEDYREVEGYLHPFRTVTNIRGIEATISDEERAQLEQMGPMLEERMRQMEEQLEDMPPEQRAMVERMMRQQMPQMEQMMGQLGALAGAEPTEITVDVLELLVNEGRPASLRP